MEKIVYSIDIFDLFENLKEYLIKKNSDLKI